MKRSSRYPIRCLSRFLRLKKGVMKSDDVSYDVVQGVSGWQIEAFVLSKTETAHHLYGCYLGPCYEIAPLLRLPELYPNVVSWVYPSKSSSW